MCTSSGLCATDGVAPIKTTASPSNTPTAPVNYCASGVDCGTIKTAQVCSYQTTGLQTGESKCQLFSNQCAMDQFNCKQTSGKPIFAPADISKCTGLTVNVEGNCA